MKLGGEVRQGGGGVGQEHNSGPLAAQKVQNNFFKSFKFCGGVSKTEHKDYDHLLFFSKIHPTTHRKIDL